MPIHLHAQNWWETRWSVGFTPSGCRRTGCRNAGYDNTWFVAHLFGTYCSYSRFKTVHSTRTTVVSRTFQWILTARVGKQGPRLASQPTCGISSCWCCNVFCTKLGDPFCIIFFSFSGRLNNCLSKQWTIMYTIANKMPWYNQWNSALD